ncbi:MAG: hypothetical protein AB8B65_05420 [Kordia sp.]|uniref:hypothetical protein n=1 Tax=Kordia sp. TaxID=1965332 RepID=UPI00385F1703
MKRSRRSEYDKKRNRSKKSSERKFQFSVNGPNNDSDVSQKHSKNTIRPKEEKRKTPDKKPKTNQPTARFTETNTTNHPIDFEVFSKRDRQYKQRTSFQKKKSLFSRFKIPIITAILMLGLGFIFSLIEYNTEKNTSEESTTNEYQNASPAKQDSMRQAYKRAYLRQDSIKKATRRENFKKIVKTDITRVIVGNDMQPKKRKARNSTYIKQIIPNVFVHIPKEFPMYNTNASPNVAIFAKNSDEYFFYSKEKPEKWKNMIMQWIDLRRSLIDESLDDYFNLAGSESYDNYRIKEADFSMIIDGFIFYGVATLIKYNNQYHFFHFIKVRSSYEKPNYDEVREKLYTYLKMELKGKL